MEKDAIKKGILYLLIITFEVILLIGLPCLIFILTFSAPGNSMSVPTARDFFTRKYIQVADFKVPAGTDGIEEWFRLDQPPSELAENIRAGSDGYHDYEVREYPNGTLLVTVREDGKVQTVATLLETTGHSLDPDYEGAEYRYRLLGSEIEIQDSPRSMVFPYGLVDHNHIGETLRLGCSYETGYFIAEFEAFYRYFIACYPEYLSENDLELEGDCLTLKGKLIGRPQRVDVIQLHITPREEGAGYLLRVEEVQAQTAV